jgi:hypothetical protein
MEHKKGIRKLAKVFAEFKFRRLGKHFMETRDYYEIPSCKILYLVRDTRQLAK